MSNPEIALLVAALISGILGVVAAFRSDFQDLDGIAIVVLSIGVVIFLLL